MRYLRLLARFTQTELQFAIEYRANLLLDLFEEVVIVVTSLLAVVVLFSHTGTINGWSLGQMIVLLGVYYLIQGAQSVFFETSFERFMEYVRLGTFDFLLIKPLNSQFMVSTRHIQVVQIGQVLFGLLLVGAGVARVGSGGADGSVGEGVQGIGFGQIAQFVVTLACGLTLVYCLVLVLATLAFWFVRIENLLVIFWSFLDAGRFPVDVYPGWLRVTLSTVVPIGVAVTIPAQAIAGRLDALGVSVMLIGTVVVFACASWFWGFGVRRYSGASA